MMYTVTADIRKIASSTGRTDAQVAESLGIRFAAGEWSAFNKSELHRVESAVNACKSKPASTDQVVYTCHECGAKYRAKWVSKYSSMPACPVCGESTMVSH